MWWWWWRRIGPRPHPDRAKHTAEATNQPHEAQSRREREKISLQEPVEKNGNSSGRIRQAGLLPLPAAANQQPRNNPASQRGANFGTVRARPGRDVKIGFFDGRGEGGREILADFSCSDFCPAPAHPLVITRIACCILS